MLQVFHRDLYKSEWPSNPDVQSNFVSSLPQVSQSETGRIYIDKEKKKAFDRVQLQYLLQTSLSRGSSNNCYTSEGENWLDTSTPSLVSTAGGGSLALNPEDSFLHVVLLQDLRDCSSPLSEADQAVSLEKLFVSNAV